MNLGQTIVAAWNWLTEPVGEPLLDALATTDLSAKERERLTSENADNIDRGVI